MKVNNQKINSKKIEVNQAFNTNGLFPPQNLKVMFKPSPKQYEMWKCLEPNSCNLCGGEIGRKESIGSSGLPTFNPVCKKCGNENIPQLVLSGGAAGGGKCMTMDSVVMTAHGEKKTRDIEVGDVICSTRNSGFQTVTFLHPIGTHEFYKFYFEDGTTSECSEGHLWTVWQTGAKNKNVLIKDESGSIRCHKTMEAKKIYEWLEKKKSGMYKGSNLKIPLTDPVELIKFKGSEHRPLHPYVMGFLLGDGCMTKTSLFNNTISGANGDIFVVDKLKSILGADNVIAKYDNKRNRYDIRLKISGIKNILENFGLSGAYSNDKFIPDVYKQAPIKERFELMQGLMDTDGYIDDRGHMEYCSSSQRLSNDVAYVVRSLGGYATVTIKKDPEYTHNGVKKTGMDSHRVYIRSPYATKMVSLPRKKERCNDIYNGGKSPFGKVIVKVEPIGKKTSRCITVSDESGEYLTNDFTVTHNSYVGCTWIAMNCIQFAGIRAVIARKTLKSLTGSTWKTLLEILDKWGLVDGINYKTNEKDGTLLFWNGSSIVKQELELLPRDPVYQRLGSSEFTIGFIDEVGEIAEKGVEVLYSRLRYKVNETFKVPKMLLTTNPVPNWVRDRFVQDKNGDRIQTRRHEAFVPFTVFDNPDKEFVQVYATSLGNMRDEKEKQRLLYGNWDFMDTKDTVIYKDFSGDKHIITNLFDKKYDPLKPLTFVWDFNVIPQMSVFMAQIDYEKKEVYIFKEFSGTAKDKNNSTPAMARDIAAYMLTLGHNGGYNITGDPSGLQRSTATEIGVNNYTIIEDVIRNHGLHASRMLLTKTPPQKTRCDFVNMIFSGELGWNIYIDLSCRLLTADMMFQEENPDGTKSKKKFTDPETGNKYEKYGHFSDNLDYYLVLFLKSLYDRYSSGSLHSGQGSYREQIVSSTPRPRFNF